MRLRFSDYDSAGARMLRLLSRGMIRITGRALGRTIGPADPISNPISSMQGASHDPDCACSRPFCPCDTDSDLLILWCAGKRNYIDLVKSV